MEANIFIGMTEYDDNCVTKTQQKKPLDFNGAREGGGNHCYLVGIRWSFIMDNIM